MLVNVLAYRYRDRDPAPTKRRFAKSLQTARPQVCLLSTAEVRLGGVSSRPAIGCRGLIERGVCSVRTTFRFGRFRASTFARDIARRGWQLLLSRRHWRLPGVRETRRSSHIRLMRADRRARLKMATHRPSPAWDSRPSFAMCRTPPSCATNSNLPNECNRHGRTPTGRKRYTRGDCVRWRCGDRLIPHRRYGVFPRSLG